MQLWVKICNVPPALQVNCSIPLGRNGINAASFAQGVSETNISCVIERGNLNKALNVIHDLFFLSDPCFMCMWPGIGNVGRKLIQQIKEQQARLRNEKSLEIKIVGISNSRNCLLDRNGLTLTTTNRCLTSRT